MTFVHGVELIFLKNFPQSPYWHLRAGFLTQVSWRANAAAP